MRALPLVLLAIVFGCAPAAIDTGPALASCLEDTAVPIVDEDGDGFAADVDCDDEDPSRGAAQPGWYDADGDGYGDPDSPAGCDTEGVVANDGDCDDTDPDIHPESLMYPDMDMDGYGDPYAGVVGCELTYRYTRDNNDCNDVYSSINPGADERCNGRDEDCDGWADEGAEAETWFPDADGDGYGTDNEGLSITACDPEDIVGDKLSWSTLAGDCDDANPNVYPGAPEEWNEGELDCDEST